MEEEVSIRNTFKECLTEMTETLGAERCPPCQQPAAYARELDRYVHTDGSDNRRCWLALTRGEATAPIRPVDGSVIASITAFGLRLNGQRVVRATNNLLRAVERHARDDASATAVLRFLLAGAHDSTTADGELWITDAQAALHGLPMWAQRDPDGFVLMLPIDASEPPMSTSPTNWTAFYRDRGSRPVDGWDADGHALVVDPRTARRVVASDLPNFDKLVQAPSIVAVLPGQGWQVAYADGTASDAVIGWLIDSNGIGTPMLTDNEGLVAAEEELPEGGFLVPPGVDPEDSPYRSRIAPATGGQG